MPRLQKKYCKYCLNFYEGFGKNYCSKSCRAKDTGVGNGIKTGKWVECKICGKSIWRKGSLLKRFNIFFCSKKCLGTNNAERINEFYKDKERKWLIGENNHEWKGDKVGKGALHDWIYRKLGKPKKCSFCKETNKNKYEWANKSGEYKRDVNDWIRLCTKCHTKYDNKAENMREIRKKDFGHLKI